MSSAYPSKYQVIKMFKSCRIIFNLKHLKPLSSNIHNCTVYCAPIDMKHFNSILLPNTRKPSNRHRRIHTSAMVFCNEKKFVINFQDFHQSDTKDKKAFIDAIRLYEHNFPNKKGHLEFINSARKQMKEFGVAEDLDMYKKLMNIMPQGPFVTTNPLAARLAPFPKQQYCIADLIDQMADYGVIPDKEMSFTLKKIFGFHSYPFEKYASLMYWAVKFKNKCPWELPKQMPTDPFMIAQMAVEQITSVDPQTEISVYQANEIQDSIDKTWIVSGQSPKQKELLEKHPPDTPVIVEAGELLWLRNKSINYFVLKADCAPFPYIPKQSTNDLLQTDTMFFNPNYVEKGKSELSVHEQDDGIIFGVCVTGTSSKDSLLSWIRLLQKNNPILGKVAVLFRFREPERSLVSQTESTKTL